MKRYGIIKKVQLGDNGHDRIIGSGKTKEEKRRDRKRARRYNNNMSRIFKIVEEVTPDAMDGDTPLEKELNAYLTARFTLSKGIPSDECLGEAKEIIKIFQKYQIDKQE